MGKRAATLHPQEEGQYEPHAAQSDEWRRREDAAIGGERTFVSNRNSAHDTGKRLVGQLIVDPFLSVHVVSDARRLDACAEIPAAAVLRG